MENDCQGALPAQGRLMPEGVAAALNSAGKRICAPPTSRSLVPITGSGLEARILNAERNIGMQYAAHYA